MAKKARASRADPKGDPVAGDGRPRRSDGKPKYSPTKPPSEDRRQAGKKPGPAGYTQEVGEKLCRYVAAGLTLIEIEKIEGMPKGGTVHEWRDRVPAFDAMFARAKILQAERMAEELLAIADDGQNDYMERKKDDGFEPIVDHEHIARSKLRIDTRKFIISKMLPKVYGDKASVELTGPGGGPIETKQTIDLTMSPKEAAEEYMKTLRKE